MKRGYTLIELLVVIAIIATLVAMIGGVIFEGCGGCTSKSNEIEEKGVSADRVLVLEEKVYDLERRLEKLEKSK